MKLIQKVQKWFADFFRSISRFPVETTLCLFAFVLVVAMCEMNRHSWMTKSFFYERFVPVALLYAPVAFAVAFAIRVGWMQSQRKWTSVCYVLSGLLVLVPPFFFSTLDFQTCFLFHAGVYILALLFVFAVRGQKDNYLFVSDAIKVCTSLEVAVFLAGAISMVYYAVMASVFYLFLSNYASDQYLFFRIVFVYVGLFILVVLTPLTFCYCAKSLQEKDAARLSSSFDVLYSKILSPALVCYTLVLYLYAAKILVAWDLPRGGVAWMVVAYLVVAFVVYMLQPFLSKTRLSFFFKYLPFISVVPLALFWVGIVRRISDYGLTESRVFIAAFGLLMMLFFAFSLLKRLNSYLLMAGMTAVAVFFLMLVPPTSALSLAVANQQKRVDSFLAKYPIYNDSTNRFVPVAEIPDACLKDTVGRKQFVSALNYIERVRGYDTSTVCSRYVPDEIKCFYGTYSSYMSFHPNNIPVSGYSYVNFATERDGEFVVDENVVLKYDEETHLDKYRSALKKACAGKEQLPDEVFYLKNDSVLVVVESIWVNYYPGDGSLDVPHMSYNGVVFSKKPLSKKKTGIVGFEERTVESCVY